MKKTNAISLLLVAGALIGLASCGDSNTGGSGNVKIMFHVDASSAEGKAYKKRIDAFNLAYAEQGYRASAQYVARTTGASQYETELLNRQTEGTLHDIVTFDAPNCASYAKSGLLYDITNLIDQSIVDDYVMVNKYNNRIYGLPIQESSAGFFYNKNLFNQAGINVSGITVDNPWTYDEFKQACDKLSKINVTPVDMRFDATKDEMAVYLLYPFVYASGGQYVSDDGYTATGYLNSESTKRGFQFLKDLITSGYSGYDIGATDFKDGKVGMYLSSGWTIPELDNEGLTNFPDRNAWGILPYPQDVTRASATGSWCFGVTNNNNTDKTATMELLKFLTTPESSKTITDATGMIPARKSVETNYAPNSPEDVLIQQLQKTGVERPSTVGYPKFSTIFNQIISELGSSDLTSLLNNKTQSLQSELDRLNK